MPLNSFNQTLTVAGTIVSVDPARRSFSFKARSGNTFEAFVGATDLTHYPVLQNLDNLNRDRVANPQGVAPPAPDAPDDDEAKIVYYLRKYAEAGRHVVVEGIYQENGGAQRYEAREVHLLHWKPQQYLFEDTPWWPTQTTQMADRILDHLFSARRNYTIDDFSELYRTNLNIIGAPTDDTTQECAVLSRLLYDLSSAYLLTGAERYLMAARAAADYMREAFRSLSHDGQYCFWAYGRRRNQEGEQGETLLFASQNGDDAGTIPLYEQIYALAGLTQFYRVTLEWEVLEDIRRTIAAFQGYFHDPPEAAEKGFAGKGGYYSHLDPVTMRPDTVTPDFNRSRKNWNSVGDHIPAYLVNLILSLEPLPQGEVRQQFAPLLERCRGMLEETSSLICEKFPDPRSDFVIERFHADWEPDLKYRWQQDRAIVGHNLKIAWNLTRCAFYFQTRAKRLRDEDNTPDADGYDQRAERCLEVATGLAERMGEVGLDKLRGGIFDCVQRNPNGGMPTQFAFGDTKDFWQQEQGILAYLILYGATRNQHYLDLARESSAFWNLFFLDHESQGYFYRTTEDGLPILRGEYGRKGGHALGYHAFELAYLAHVYTRIYVAEGKEADTNFCLYFKISSIKQQRSINVLPDFMPAGRVRITSVRANGVEMSDQLDPADLAEYQVPTDAMPPDPEHGTVELVVEFQRNPDASTGINHA
jgi:mannose/cellobiose epimerase-like protein (N-acyl-D-glucosamine 2-epimerase family)